MARSSTHHCLTAALLLALGACGSGGNDSGAMAYVQGLPAFPAPPEDFDRATGPATITQGASEACSTTPYSLSSTPKDVVMFNGDPQIMWPGALIVGTSYQSGGLELLPITERAPLNLSIQGVYAGNTSATVAQPTGSSVTAAVNRLLAQAVKDQTVPTNSIYFKQTSAYSVDQAALKLGLSAHYLGASAKASVSVQTSSTENTVVAYALVRMFTVAVDPPSTPDAFFQGLTKQTLDEQTALGRIGPNNVPVYVASVTYGQIMMMSITAQASASDIKAAVSASFNSFAGGGSGALTASQQQLLSTATIEVVTLGGNGNAVRSMIVNGQPSDFFIGTDLITNAVPIAYTLKDLQGNVAKVAETSDYTLTTCTQNGFANLYVANENGGTVTGYSPDGTQATLNQSITGLTGVHALAYDALDDVLFTMDYAGGVTPRIQAFAPDGTPSTVVTTPFSGLQNPSALAYDPQRARLYVVDAPDTSGFGIIRAYTTTGALLNQFFHANQTGNSYAVAYDAVHQRLYVGRSTGSESGGFITVFSYDGSDITPATGFGGLVLPESIAYDAADDRVFVADYYQGEVFAFDSDGNPVALDHPITGINLPHGLVFDDVHNRLYVAVQGTSTIQAYEPNGNPVTALATPAFPNVNSPSAIALRP